MSRAYNLIASRVEGKSLILVLVLALVVMPAFTSGNIILKVQYKPLEVVLPGTLSYFSTSLFVVHVLGF